MIDWETVVKKNITLFRELNNMTMPYCAERLGITTSALFKIEKGEQRVTIPFLNSICNEFNIPITYFFEEEKITDFEKWNKWGNFIETMEEKGILPIDLISFISFAENFSEKQKEKNQSKKNTNHIFDTVSRDVSRIIKNTEMTYHFFEGLNGIYYARNEVFSDKLYVILSDGNVLPFDGTLPKNAKRIDSRTDFYRQLNILLNKWQRGELSQEEIMNVINKKENESS